MPTTNAYVSAPITATTPARAEDQALLGVAQVDVQVVLDERQRHAQVRAIQVIQ
ncbi:hypothetical protein AB0L64_30975 [Kribbella sp. NPDC051936]|uniref:hypothetical protein n=1 Tax=Kribbella sp. NPDC051936 TaxID=3154946 RepID=UPI00343A641B